MDELIKKFKDALKCHLVKNKSSYVEHHSMIGCTEEGFHDVDIFDIYKLMTEIDEFAATFKKKT